MDIISLDLSQRLSLKKEWFVGAMARGVHVEIAYGMGLEGHSERKVFLRNCMTIVKMTKGGAGMVMASEAPTAIC